MGTIVGRIVGIDSPIKPLKGSHSLGSCHDVHSVNLGLKVLGLGFRTLGTSG